MGNFLLDMQTEVRSKTADLGPGGAGRFLPSSLDPYIRRSPAVQFGASSVPGRRGDMTYRILLDTLVGLLDVMYIGNQRNEYVYCVIIDQGVRVGTAVVGIGNGRNDSE